MVIDDIFKENVKNSFKKAREHMEDLEKDVNKQNKDISDFKNEINRIFNDLADLKLKITFDSAKISIGNEGVLNKQTNKQTVKQTNKHIIIDKSGEISKFQTNIEEFFKNLTKQELLSFLTIYQLEEELGQVKFSDVSKHLNLSESCIRGYVKRLLDKGAPLTRTKVNNKLVLLSILQEFRTLDLKKRLTNLYYEADSNQTKLFDSL